MALRRDHTGRTTTWHLLEDEDPQTYEPLGTFTWYENEEPVSLAVTPHLTYGDMPNAIADADATPRRGVSHTPYPAPQYYDLHGRRLLQAPRQGLYIVRQPDGSIRKTF
jgi:hypothetical protein